MLRGPTQTRFTAILFEPTAAGEDLEVGCLTASHLSDRSLTGIPTVEDAYLLSEGVIVEGRSL